MTPRKPRPPTLAGQRAGNSKGLGGTFEFQNSETLSQAQDDDRSSVPNAHTRIVFGRKASFIHTFRVAPCADLSTRTDYFLTLTAIP
jgi:hypothetical protein